MKKTTNKGFSMVELIIVIAIMAILAAALAPALIKYINKSRLSTDVQTGTTIASAINSALAVESAYDSAESYDKSYTAVNSILANANNNSFAAEVAGVVGQSQVNGKAKKDLAGSAISPEFYCYVDVANNKVTIWAGSWGTADTAHIVSPVAGPSMAE